MKVKGKHNFESTPQVNGTNVSVEGHTHVPDDVTNLSASIDTQISGTNLDVLADVVASSPSSGSVLKFDGSNWIPGVDGGGGGGETNTASNVGTGHGWFESKSGVDLQFRSLLTGSSKLSSSLNANDITVDVVESSIQHDNLAGYVANEHIDWTTDQGATNIHSGNLVLPSHNHTLSDVTDAGTAASYDVPAAGDAAAGEVVKGDDSRLSAVDDMIDDGSTAWNSGGAVTGSATSFAVDVAAGTGHVYMGGSLMNVAWTDGSVVLNANKESYVYVTSAGSVTGSETMPSHMSNIVLASVLTDGTEVVSIAEHYVKGAHHLATRHMWFRDVVGPLWASGITCTTGSNPLTIDVTGGSYYSFDLKRAVTGGSPVAFSRYWYQTSPGAWTTVKDPPEVNTGSYNDITSGLTAMPSGSWRKDLMAVIKNTDGEEYHLIFGQETFTSQSLAEAGSVPTRPDYLTDFALNICGVVIQSGSTAVASHTDERQRLGQLSTGATQNAASDHGSLSGINDDDHAQYIALAGNGSRNVLTGIIDATGGTINLANNEVGDPELADMEANTIKMRASGTLGDPENVKISHLTAEASPAAGDFLLGETAEGSLVKIDVDNLPGGGNPSYAEVTATADTTTTSATYVQINSMTVTPTSGTYKVEFSSSIEGAAKDQMIMLAIFKGGTIISHTRRHVHKMSGHVHVTQYPVHTAAKVTVNGSEAIEVRWMSDGSNTATCKERNLNYLAVT